MKMKMKMKKKKICLVTTTRADYGHLKWLMRQIKKDRDSKLQVIATGAHLSGKFGLTYKEIENDGFHIDKKVPLLLCAQSRTGVLKGMGLLMIEISKAFNSLDPDIVVVLGDRYELLSICSAALILGIPIAHISGGDITEGAIDNQIRHALTKMAHLHFPSTHDSAARVIQMGESPQRVFVTGELSLANFKRLKRCSKIELAKQLGLDIKKRWVIYTYHPETLIPLTKNLERVENTLKVLSAMDCQVVMTYPNADFGSAQIIRRLAGINKLSPQKFKFFKSLGQSVYNNLMRQAYAMLGNSSSGIFESPSAGLAVINIGDRQKGRIMAANIINAQGSCQSIKQAFAKIERESFRRRLKNLKNPYGDGRAAQRIAGVLKRFDFSELNPKVFYRISAAKSRPRGRQ